MLTDKEIKKISEKISKTYNPKAIYLFGSYAYGNPNENSDLDLLVIDERADNKEEDFSYQISLDLFPRKYGLGLITISPQKLEQRKDYSFWQEVLSRGRKLYERV